jgi:hypothetical protein
MQASTMFGFAFRSLTYAVVINPHVMRYAGNCFVPKILSPASPSPGRM